MAAKKKTPAKAAAPRTGASIASNGDGEAKKPARRRRKPTVEAGSRGLAASEVAGRGARDADLPQAVVALRQQVEADGGAVLTIYREPLSGKHQLLAALPLDKVQPAPFQRDLSETHVAKLAQVMDRLGRFLDPIVAVRAEDGYWTPNGHHRLAAVRQLGGRSILALVVPEPEIAWQILALNTEKAPNLKDRSLEVLRLARELARLDPRRRESDYAAEFEEAAFLTLGLCYEQAARFSGSVYQPVLRRVDVFLDAALPDALAERAQRAGRVLELDAAVGEAVEALKERGLQSPYLKAFVMARVNFLRFVKGDAPSFDSAIERMIGAAREFDARKVEAGQLASAAGPPED